MWDVKVVVVLVKDGKVKFYLNYVGCKEMVGSS